jgi:enoyl-[acyl-carrier-protein] reductase (NADH)
MHLRYRCYIVHILCDLFCDFLVILSILVFTYSECVNILVSIAKALCDQLSASHAGVRVLPVRADCSKEQEVEAMFRTITKELGHIDILVG